MSVLTPRSAQAELTDIRGPVRVGWGWSGMYRAKITSLSFEDEMAVRRLGDSASLLVVFGMDGMTGPPFPFPGPGGQPLHKGFLGLTVGTGLEWRLVPDGPLAVVDATAGPLWESWSEDLVPHGFGASLRTELFPFYLNIADIASCGHSKWYTYILSGLNGWTSVRQDWLGADTGATWAVGFGFELGRNFVLPILDEAVGPLCK
jgi:hypothetical protein